MPLRRRKCLNLPLPPRTRSQPSNHQQQSPGSSRSNSSPPHTCPEAAQENCIAPDERVQHVLFPSPNRQRRRPIIRSSSPLMVVGKPNSQTSRPSSTHSSCRQSPSRKLPDPPQLLQTLSDLTIALNTLTQRRSSEEVAIGPSSDPDFEWSKLLLPPPTHFPAATEGQVQLLAEGLLAKLSTLHGRELHDVEFVLSMASMYPVLNEAAQNVIYQRLNLLYIAAHYGWSEALSASSMSAASAAVLPPGYHISLPILHDGCNKQVKD